jgi:drug/metabolite transporter (DMT)-like permease
MRPCAASCACGRSGVSTRSDMTRRLESQVRALRRRVIARPTPAALTGALAIAFSAIFYRFAEVSPSTGAFFRCALALPLLWLLARREDAHLGPRDRRARAFAAVAGVFFAVDLLFWHHAIEAVGAGLATVLANMQIVLFGLIAWVAFRERPAAPALVAVPLTVVGIVLISGLLETGAYGDNPSLGAVLGVLAGLAYSGVLVCLRYGAPDVRRVGGPLFDVTLVAALVAIPSGFALGELDVTPGPRGILWLALLALSSQVVGWLLITASLGRLPAIVTSILLTLQPVGSVIFAALLLGERPSALQLVGTVAILAGLVVGSIGTTRAGGRSESPAPAG